MAAEQHRDETHRAFAKFGDGAWYSILPGMEGRLRAAGAEVRVISLSEIARIDAVQNVASANCCIQN